MSETAIVEQAVLKRALSLIKHYAATVSSCDRPADIDRDIVELSQINRSRPESDDTEPPSPKRLHCYGTVALLADLAAAASRARESPTLLSLGDANSCESDASDYSQLPQTEAPSSQATSPHAPSAGQTTGKFTKEEDALYLRLLKEHGQPVNDNPRAAALFEAAFWQRKKNSITAHINAFNLKEYKEWREVNGGKTAPWGGFEWKTIM